jgi:hypothetical protein
MAAFQLRILFTSDDVQINAAAEVLAAHTGQSPDVTQEAVRNVIDGELRIFEFPDEASAQACAETVNRLGLVTKVTPKR